MEPLKDRFSETNPRHDWRSFNAALDRQNPFLVNEAWLARKIAELETVAGRKADEYRLTLARLNELALFCAGQYADAGELEAVGDLLVNPRTILVHVKGEARPVRKERHTPLTEQFRDRAGIPDVKQWLKDNTMLELKEPALLPALLETLKKSGRVEADYLRSVEDRHLLIADTVSMVSSCRFPQLIDFKLGLARMNDVDRALAESRFCRFDLAVFADIGREIDRLTANPVSLSRIPNPPVSAWLPRIGALVQDF